MVTRARAGELAALAELLQGQRPVVLDYIRRHMPADLQRVTAAEDVLQDVFFETCRRAAQLELPDEDAARRWLMTLARNRIYELARHHHRLKRGGGGGAGGDGQDKLVEMLADLAVHERTPSRSAASHELIAALQRAVDRLGDDYRQVIRLRYVDALPVAEIAARMNRSEGSIHMLANRALKALRLEMVSLSRYA